MDLTLVETILRGLGGLFTAITLGFIFYGIWRGTRRPVGRQVGRAPRLLQSGIFYFVTSIIYFGTCILLWRPLPLALSPTQRLAALVLGSLIFFPGMALTLWGRLALGGMYFVSTGMGAQLFTGHKLVTRGPFAIVRHPMYTGIAVAVLGGILLYQTWTLVSFLILPLGFLRRARGEEQALAAEFGEAWQEYCRDTPAFIPRLKRP